MPTTEWLKKYEAVKKKLERKTDLDAYFTKKAIGNMLVSVLEIGAAQATSHLRALPPAVRSLKQGG